MKRGDQVAREWAIAEAPCACRAQFRALATRRFAFANFENRSGRDRLIAERIEQAHPIPPGVLGNERVARVDPLGRAGRATRRGAAEARRAVVVPEQTHLAPRKGFLTQNALAGFIERSPAAFPFLE